MSSANKALRQVNANQDQSQNQCNVDNKGTKSAFDATKPTNNARTNTNIDEDLQKPKPTVAVPTQQPAQQQQQQATEAMEVDQSQRNASFCADDSHMNTPLGKPRGCARLPARYGHKLDHNRRLERQCGECHLYIESVGRNQRELEIDLLIDPEGFRRIQTDLKPRMRTILFAWIVDVHIKFEMHEQVLWLCWALIDAYLSKVNVQRNELQLLSCAALWIASKYVEIYPPVMNELVHVSDNAFTKERLVEMEVKICRQFGMCFTQPTVHSFLVRYTDIAVQELREARQNNKTVNRVRFLAFYGAERMMLDPRALEFKPSLIAAAATYTALCLTSFTWSENLAMQTGFTSDDFKRKYHLFQLIKEHIMSFDCKAHEAVIRKYAAKNRGEVSTLRKKQPNRNPKKRQRPAPGGGDSGNQQQQQANKRTRRARR